VAQDPIRARKADRWDSLVNSGASPEEATKTVEREFAEQPSAPPQTLLGKAKKAYTDEMKKDVADFTAMFTNIPGAEEVGGAVTGMLPGGMNYQQGRQFVARKREEAKAQMDGGRYAALSAVPTVAIGAASGGSSILSRALMSAGLEGTKGFLGARANPADTKAPTLGERAAAAVSPAAAAGLGGAAVEGLLKAPAALVRGVARVATKIPYGGPLVDAVTQGAKGTAQSAARSASDALAKRAAPFLEGVERTLPFGMTRAMDAVEFAPSSVARALSRAIEPMDTQKIARLGAETLPGRAGSGSIGAINEASRRATEAAKSLEGEFGSAKSEASEAGTRIVERAKATGGKLLARAEQKAQTTLQQLQAEAERLVGPLRTPNESAAALRTATRKLQTEAAQPAYKLVESLPSSDKYYRGIYQRIKSDDSLDKNFLLAVDAKRQRLLTERLGAEGADLEKGVPNVRMKTYKTGTTTTDPITGVSTEDTVPALDLEIIDTMRRNIMDGMDSHLSNASTGISRSEGRRQLAQVKNLEKDFFKTVPAEQRDALVKARAQQEEYFQSLEYLMNGQNIRRFAIDAKEEILGAGKNDLRELLSEVGELRKAATKGDKAAQSAVTHFEVGVRQSIADMAASTSDDAAKIINELVGTSEARMRAGQALSPNFIKQLQMLTPDQAKRTAAAFAGPTAERASRVVARGERQAARVTGEAQKKVGELQKMYFDQAKRAEQLKFVSDIPFEQIMAGGQPAETFANITSKQLGGFGDRAVPGVFGSILQSQIAGLTPKQSLAKLMEMDANPAIRQQMGPQIRALIGQIQKNGTPDALKTARQLFVGQKAAELTR